MIHTNDPIIKHKDSRLNIKNGFNYSLNCLVVGKDRSSGDYCAGHINCGGGCSGSSGSTDSSGGFFDGLFDGSDSGGGGCGGGCGGD